MNKEKTNYKYGKGMIIIKSHAVKQGIHLDIIELLKNRSTTGYLKTFHIQENVKNDLIKVFITDIKEIRVDPKDNFFDIVYPKDILKPHFSILKKEYSGKNILIGLGYDGTQENLQNLLKEIKGRGEVIDSRGNIINKGIGIRGHVIKPSNYVSDDLLKLLSEEEYKTIISSILNNILHTTNTKEEYDRIMAYLKKYSSLLG